MSISMFPDSNGVSRIMEELVQDTPVELMVIGFYPDGEFRTMISGTASRAKNIGALEMIKHQLLQGD